MAGVAAAGAQSFAGGSMLAEIVIVMLFGASAFVILARTRRNALYTSLHDAQLRLLAEHPPPRLRLGSQPSAAGEPGPVIVDDLLDPADLAEIRAEAERLVGIERSYLPVHKKGGTIAYETLNRSAPRIVALYLSPALQALVGELTGERGRIQPTPIHDQSSLSLLFYDRPGDHIGWHYDHNFYRGRHFTVLIPLINQGHDAEGLSHARLLVREATGDRVIATPPNRLILFEGAKVLHKVTPIREGERRVVLSMTFCTDPRDHWWQGLARRVKDVGFFGLRALWT